MSRNLTDDTAPLGAARALIAFRLGVNHGSVRRSLPAGAPRVLFGPERRREDVVTLLQDMLVGTFRLVSLQARSAADTVTHPFGVQPVGLFVFDREGNFSVQLTNPDRTADEAAAGTGFTGMFGTYVVDEDRQAFVATPVGASHPALVGAEILRFVRPAGGDLAVFNTPPQTTGGIEWTTYITWRKVSSP